MQKLNNNVLKKFEGLYEKFCNTEINWFVKYSCCVLKLETKNLDDLKSQGVEII